MKPFLIFSLLLIFTIINSSAQLYTKNLEDDSLPGNKYYLSRELFTYNDLLSFTEENKRIQISNTTLSYSSEIETWHGKMIYSIDTLTYQAKNKIYFKLVDIENFNELAKIYRQSDSSGKVKIRKDLYNEIYYINIISVLVPQKLFEPFSSFQEADLIKLYSIPDDKCTEFYSINKEKYCNKIKLKSSIRKPKKEDIQPFLENNQYGFIFSLCYFPRDAIEFYSAGKKLGYIEICFECDEARFYNYETKKFLRLSINESFIKYFDNLKNK